MKNQAYHIQSLLADKLNRCKDKGNTYADNHIMEIQNTYQNKY